MTSLILILIVCACAFTPAELVEKYRPRTQCETAIKVFEDQLKPCIYDITHPMSRQNIVGDDLICSWGFAPDPNQSHTVLACALARLRGWGHNITFANHFGMTALMPPLPHDGNMLEWSWVVRIPGMNATLALYN